MPIDCVSVDTLLIKVAKWLLWYFSNWSDECCWRNIYNWININVSTLNPRFVNPLTPGAFCPKLLFWTFWRNFLLDIGICNMTACLSSTSIVFYDILARACVEIKILRWEGVLRAVIGLLNWGCLQLKNFRESIIKMSKFYRGVAMCNGRKFCSEFFTQLFVHISGAIRLSTLIWVLLGKSFPPGEFEYRWC